MTILAYIGPMLAISMIVSTLLPIAPSQSSDIRRTEVTSSNNNKVVILSFDDGWKNQYTKAKPILDKYGFKATFFVVCDYIGGSDRMSWQEISSLYNQGYKIESHSMSHHRLDKMSANTLNFELEGSKQCLLNHGINSTVFAYPFNRGWEYPNIVTSVAKYYNLARTGHKPLTFLHCDGYRGHPQTDCRTYYPNGTLTYANRYSLRSWTHNTFLNNETTFSSFVKEVNSQINYNKDGKVNAIPIITYHQVDYVKDPVHTNVDLFDVEMKYLHDNGFNVLTMSNLGYDEEKQIIYIHN